MRAGVSNFKTCSADSKAVGSDILCVCMGEALFDLEQLLKSQKEALTLEEANILQTCKFKAVRQFTAGVITGATTWKLSRFAQANISGGNAIKALDDCLFSFDTCVDHILAMDGSRLQKELANIIPVWYPWLMHKLAQNIDRVSDKFFCFMAPVEEIHHPGASGKPARLLNRSQKRTHRGVKWLHRETSLDSEHLQTV
ncbi:Mitochondrial intermediate peptidase [Salix suchowensis]|nr:Mitochondrial intermediate peptidase [Salix suchowensis]